MRGNSAADVLSATRYDEILYPAHPYGETHFARLATLGSLYGMDPAPLAGTRVLELGCGSGGNLVPMACQYPESEFLGIDLSRRAVELGTAAAAALELGNLELRHGDIMEVTAEFGRFDHIIAHGLYSWVPRALRDKVMAIFADHLSPHGIGFVSYNAYPGSHLRDIVRDVMLYHTRHFDDPNQQIGQARAILAMLSEASDPATVHGAVMRDQLARVQRIPDILLFHDDLDRNGTAFLLHDVVTHAQRHGLQYLCDAVLSRRDRRRYSPAIRDSLAGFPDSQFMAQDQYQDFIDGHGFRRTLLCRADVRLTRTLAADCVTRFHLASSAMPSSADIDPGDARSAEFKVAGGGKLTTDHRLGKAALICLGARWPEALGFAALVREAQALLAARTDACEENCSEANVEGLMRVLFEAASAGHVELSLHPPRLTTRISTKPLASRLARHQAQGDALVTNLHHDVVELDERMRRLLRLIDGTRTIDELVADLRAATVDLPLAADEPDLTRENVEKCLAAAAKLGLLVE